MDVVTTLQALGLTQAEALVYTYLVAHPGATGYRVARGVGKATANVYHALESLERKGAVIRDQSPAPLFQALTPAELLARLEREFMERKQNAARELASLRPETDDQPQAPRSAGQALQRARAILAGARRIVVVDAPADFLDTLAADLEAVRSRGARVVMIARGSPSGMQGAAWVDREPAAGQGRRVRMAVDGREALLAELSTEGARDTVWTRSEAFAATIHDAITAELFFLDVGRGVDQGLSVDEVEESFERCREIRDDSGA